MRSTQLSDIQEKYVKNGLEITINLISLKKPKRNILILGVYRPPQSKSAWFENFNDLLLEVSTLGKTIIMGDLNANILNPTVSPAKELLNSLASANTKITSFEPTRITATTATCLDLIAIDEHLQCLSYEVVNIALSDHLPVTARINSGQNEPIKPILKRSFNKVDFLSLGQQVMNIQLGNSNQNEPNLMLENWQRAFTGLIDQVAPLKNYPMRKSKSPWITNEIRKLIEDRDMLSAQLKKAPSSIVIFEATALAKRRVKSRIKREAKNQGKEAFRSEKPEDAWKFIKLATYTEKESSELTVGLPALNEHFATVVNSNNPNPNVAPPLSCETETGFSFELLSCESVERAISMINSKTASGHDGLQAFVLKQLASAISPNITVIFNSSLVHHIFPTDWKHANITAIYKNKGSKNDPANYRPISVIPILARIFEKLVATQLYNYCEMNRVIPDEQFGFRCKSSCETALISATTDWLQAIDNGMYVGALLVDLSKAFDTVPHGQLIQALLEIGCRNEVLQWFSSYLSDRKQRVSLHDEITPWKTISRGVPQGSCLSPLLFNIFVRELPMNTNAKTFQFADDTTNYVADMSLNVISDKLALSFNATKQFCLSHELEINTNKTQFIIFKAPGKKIPDDYVLTVDNHSIKPEQSVKLLGVTLDKHLTYGEHIQTIASKCNGLLGILARSSTYLTIDLMRMMYLALIRSHLEYCSSLFVPSAKTNLNKLDTIQRKAARAIFQLPRDSHAEPLLAALHFEPLNERREAHTLNLVKSFTSGNCHPKMKNMFATLPNESIKVQNFRTKMGNRSFSVIGANLYNNKNFNLN